MTEHKHAEVLRAIADIRPVEWKCSHETKWKRGENLFAVNPISNPALQWRVAPPEWQEALRQAVRDGKVVEWWDGRGWIVAHVKHFPDDTFPPLAKEVDYRIRPEPKPDIVKTAAVKQESIGCHTFNWCLISENPNANIAFTFDGETGLLKSAEILK